MVSSPDILELHEYVYLKLKDEVLQLTEEVNLWRRWAGKSSSRNVETDEVIGNYELPITPGTKSDTF